VDAAVTATGDRASRRCTRCIFPDSLPGITFSDDGTCNHCRAYEAPQVLGEDELKKVLEGVRARRAVNRSYDCIVPVSGGRDSAYVLFMAKRLYGLRVLAVNFDNEFQTPQARANVRTACGILNVPLLTYRSRWGTGKKTVHYALRAALSYGIRAVANCFCNACSYGYRACAYIAARRYDVPLILWGESAGEYTQHMSDEHLRLGLAGRIKKQLSVAGLLYRVNLYRQRLEFPVRGNFWRSLALLPPRLKSRRTREIAVFDYVPWNRDLIKRTITRELGWRKPEDAVSTWRIDCKLDRLVTYCYYSIFGCSKHCFGYHNMINDRQMTREEALEQELQTCSVPDAGLEDLLAGDVGLRPDEVDRILSFSRGA
jgi:glucosamine--fructose-6-phosphate aminotransferase (isomerizing)